jgi:hypothetical protein
MKGAHVGSRRGKGEGSIYQREDGVWIGAIDLGWNGGKRLRKVVSAPTRGEVVKRLRDLQPAIAQGITPASDRLTVSQYLNDWVVDRIPGTITTRTEELYARAVRDYIAVARKDSTEQAHTLSRQWHAARPRDEGLLAGD